MAVKEISIGEALGFGWEKFKANVGFFILLLLAMMVVPFAYMIAAAIVGGLLGFIGYAIGIGEVVTVLVMVLIYVGYLAVIMLLQIGMIKIPLGFCDNQVPKITDLLSGKDKLLTYTLGSILFFLIVTAGMFLFVIPGIIFALMFCFYGFLIVDKGMKPVDALKKSAEITKGVRPQLFLFAIVLWLVNLLGMLCLFVGVFVSLPVTFLATAYVYRKLLMQSEGAA
ncbi:MAG: hypothetical protein HQ564_07130 [Candidatus Saganbacteria bacterium]|nr:hypothetical protein [Candidatus Saganbacteria bacterium]